MSEKAKTGNIIFEIGVRVVSVMLIFLGVLDRREELAVGGCVLLGSAIVAAALARLGRRL